jgi:hypothetical protein
MMNFFTSFLFHDRMKLPFTSKVNYLTLLQMDYHSSMPIYLLLFAVFYHILYILHSAFFFGYYLTVVTNSS